MAPEVPDGPLATGAPYWYWLGGRPALDLVNTRRERWRRNVECLDRATATPAGWLVAATCCPSRARPPRGLRGEARELREAIDAGVRAAVAGEPADPAALRLIDDWLVLAGLAARAGARPTTGLPVLAERAPADSPRRALGTGRARRRAHARHGRRSARASASAARRPARPASTTARPPARRRWCSMQACGNVEKARAARPQRRQRGVKLPLDHPRRRRGGPGGALGVQHGPAVARARVLRDEFDLSLTGVGLVLASVSWGIVRDAAAVGRAGRPHRRADRDRRRPRRRALALVGAALCARLRRCSARRSSWPGAFGASAAAASGRAVMGWFGRSERGMALGVRQMARAARRRDRARSRCRRSSPRAACAPRCSRSPPPACAGALAAAHLDARAAAGARRPRRRVDGPAAAARPPRLAAVGRLRRCSSARRSRWSPSSSSSCTTSAASRRARRRPAWPRSSSAAASRASWSGPLGPIDGRRIAPLRRHGIAMARRARGGRRARRTRPLVLLLPVLLLAGVLTMSWNGLSFTAAAEMAGPRARGHRARPAGHDHARGLARSPRHRLRRARRRPRSWPRRLRRADRCCRSPAVAAAAARARGGGAPARARTPACASATRPAERPWHDMSDEVQSGLEGVVAFATEIAEPDKRRRRAALPRRRHRGPRRQGARSSRSGACSSTGRSSPACRPPSRIRSAIRSGDPRVDVQAALAMLGAGVGLPGADRHLRRAGARRPRARLGDGALVRRPVRARRRAARRSRSARSTRRSSIPERFLIRWRGEADPDHVKAIDAYWISAAEHGMNASTFTARVDRLDRRRRRRRAERRGRRAVAARCTAARPSRVLKMLDEVEALGRRRALGQATRSTAATA